jgi:hypothetical protein
MSVMFHTKTPALVTSDSIIIHLCAALLRGERLQGFKKIQQEAAARESFRSAKAQENAPFFVPAPDWDACRLQRRRDRDRL